MKTMKKILSVMLALILCVNLGVSALSSGAVSPDAEGLATFSGVEEIANSAMYGETKLKKLVIEEGVKSIGSYSFGGCTALTEVTLPVSLTSIGGGAFSGCTALETVYYAGTEAQASAISIGLTNDPLKNAEWVYLGSDSGDDNTGSGDDTTGGDNTTGGDDTTGGDTTDSAKLGFEFSDATVIAGENAVVTLSLSEACTRLGAQLKVKAATASGSALEISSIVLSGTGSVNEDNDGTIVLAEGGELAAGTLLATITFKTASAGSYTVSLSGEAYTGEDNALAEIEVSTGTVTVKEPTVNVEWVNHDGSVLDSQTVDIGSVPVYAGETPTKASDRLYSYSFSGWDKASAAVNEDTVYTAQFSSAARSYSVTFDCGIDGAEYSVKNSNGITVTAAADGSFKLSATETYTVSVSAVGCVETSFTISISDEDADWSFSGDSATLSIASPEAHIGDVDDDGDVDMQDAQALFNYLAGNITVGSDGIAYSAAGAVVFNSNVADINASGGVGAEDILPMLDLVTE